MHESTVIEEAGPYTPEKLLGIALDAQARYEALRVEFPPGTVHEGRNEAYRLQELAMACAEWMEVNRLSELSHVGPFGKVPFRRGEVVRVRKGSAVHSTRSGQGRDGVVSKASSNVKVAMVTAGFVDREKGAVVVTQPKIEWRGAGGYWRWTSVTNVEKAVASAETQDGA